jgi:putative membrane protein
MHAHGNSHCISHYLSIDILSNPEQISMAYHWLINSVIIKCANCKRTMKQIANILLAAVLCAVAAPVLGDDMSATNPVPVVTPADFVWDASLVNLKEIRLGEAAQTNSQNADVQNFGKHMVRDHTRMNEHLARIANAEGLQLPDTNVFYVPVTPPPVEKEATELMNETPQQRLQQAQWDVQSLAALSGPAFDQAYADAMVKGHAMVLQKLQDASAALTDEQLKKYADRSARVVRDHYEMAQKLQSEVETNAPAGMTNSVPNM